jgi:predicted dehydrogenase
VPDRSGAIDQVTGEPRVSVVDSAAQSADAGREERFRFGVAGYDLWPHAINFCRVLRDASFLDIVAVWDDDPRELERLVDLTGATGYANLEEFCNSDIQGAVITARTSERRSIAQRLAAAGKHVLSDKPMAMNADEGFKIIQACKDAGVVLMGGYNFRFWKVWPLMKEILAAGELGDPFHYYCAYNTGMIRRTEWDETLRSDWTDASVTPGGGWLTHGDHAVDLIRWLSGAEFVDVLADMRNLRYPEFDVEDYGVAHYTLSNGGTALIHSDAISDRIRLDFIVACPNGGMSYSISPEPRLKVWGAPSLGAEVVEFTIDENWVDALGNLSRAFVETIESGEDPPITGVDNMRVMEVVDATYRSAREGRTISVNTRQVPR